MRFEMTHKFFKTAPPELFSELSAPDWLTSANTIPGSTMDNRWFWREYVLTLLPGEAVETDFHWVARIA